jgi:hypothetical protein
MARFEQQQRGDRGGLVSAKGALFQRALYLGQAGPE